jgi:hypothetical protein
LKKVLVGFISRILIKKDQNRKKIARDSSEVACIFLARRARGFEKVSPVTGRHRVGASGMKPVRAAWRLSVSSRILFRFIVGVRSAQYDTSSSAAAEILGQPD